MRMSVQEQQITCEVVFWIMGKHKDLHLGTVGGISVRNSDVLGLEIIASSFVVDFGLTKPQMDNPFLWRRVRNYVAIF